mgnify:CR=1 FL=1
MADPYIGPGLPGVAQPAPVTQKTVGGMTPAELAAAAKRAAQQIIDPQLAAAKSILSAADSRALNAEGAFRALAAMRQGAVGDTQQAYQTAAGSTAAFSKGYSDAMQAKLNGNAKSINEFLAQMGAPQGQMVNPGQSGDVVYGLTGAVPASSLAAQGAAAGAYAAQQPGNAIAAGNAAAAILKGDAQSAYADAVAKINAGLPDLVLRQQEFLAKQAADKQKMTDERSKIDTALSAKVGVLVNSWGEAIPGKDGKQQPLPGKKEKAPSIDLAVSKQLGYYSDSTGAAITKDGQPVPFKENTGPQKIDSGVSKMLGYVADSTGAPVLSKAGKVVQYKDTGSTSDSLTLAKSDQDFYSAIGVVSRIKMVDGRYVAEPVKDGKGQIVPTRQAVKDEQKYTPAQLDAYRGQAYTFADAAYKGVPATYNKDGSEKTPAHPRLSYQDALAEALKTGIPLKTVMDALNATYPPNAHDSLPPGGVYKMGRAGVFLYDDQREATQNNTGAAIIAKITPDDPRFREAVGRAIDPVTLKPLSAAAKRQALGGKTSKRVRDGGPRVEVPANAGPFASAVLSEAENWLGTPYSWGGGNTDGPTYGTDQGKNIKGFDCSAFAQYLYQKAGTTIPRTTYEQWRVGSPVPIDQLQPGDLVFFDMETTGPGHVGIYAGNGKFVHAPHTGDVVKVSELDGYYRRKFVGGRRYEQNA